MKQNEQTVQLNIQVALLWLVSPAVFSWKEIWIKTCGNPERTCFFVCDFPLHYFLKKAFWWLLGGGGRGDFLSL